MNKDFTEKKLLSFSEEKVLRALYSLARFIEVNQEDIDSNSFKKLQKYHSFLKHYESDKVTKINKEFFKIKSKDYQYQVYLMNLERFLGQSLKEYEFAVSVNDTKRTLNKFNIVCILDSIRSAYNVGAMLRNSECFGAKKVYLTGLSPQSNHPQVIKTSMGCEMIVDNEFIKDPKECVRILKEDGYKIISVETTKDSTRLEDFSYNNEKIALIFGHELHGISLELLKLSDEVISIGLFGNKNSLNVSVCQAVVLHELTKGKSLSNEL